MYLEGKIKTHPTQSIRSLAAEMNVSRTTMQTAVKKDLGLTSFSRQQRQLLTAADKANRVERGQCILIWLQHLLATVKIFSDKKDLQCTSGV